MPHTKESLRERGLFLKTVRQCGAKARWGGICEACGVKQDKFLKHRGKCPVCGGQMRCQQKAMRNRKRCRKHGGKTAAGVASHFYRHGRGSKNMSVPPGIRQLYEESCQDPKLMSCERDIAILDARVKQVLNRLTGPEFEETTRFRQRLSEMWAEMEDASRQSRGLQERRAAGRATLDEIELHNKLLARIGELMTGLGDLIRRGVKEDELWFEIREAIAERTKTVAAENKRRRDLGLMITESQGWGIINQVGDLVQRVSEAMLTKEVKEEFLDRVGRGLEDILNQRSRTAPAQIVSARTEPVGSV